MSGIILYILVLLLIAAFVELPLKDNNQVLVKGYRPLGKDGGNRLEQECA